MTRYGATTLEDAFFTATGIAFEDEQEVSVTTSRASAMSEEPQAGGPGGLLRQLIGLGGVIERNAYLVKRYAWWELAFFIWTVANSLSIVFIAKGVQAAGGHLNVERATTTLLIGAVIWAYSASSSRS